VETAVNLFTDRCSKVCHADDLWHGTQLKLTMRNLVISCLILDSNCLQWLTLLVGQQGRKIRNPLLFYRLYFDFSILYTNVYNYRPFNVLKIKQNVGKFLKNVKNAFLLK